MPFSNRLLRQGPSHQTSRAHVRVDLLPARSHKASQDAPDTTYNFYRSPLFGSAVPTKPRTDTVKRPSTAWHDTARKMRQRHPAAGNSNGNRSSTRNLHYSSETQVDTEQEHEVAEALFDLANMFARPAAPEPARKLGSYASVGPTRPNGLTSKLHRHRTEQPRDSPKRHATAMSHRDHKRAQNREWHADKAAYHSTDHQHDYSHAKDTNAGAHVSTPRAVKAPQTTAAPGPGSMGQNNAPAVSLGSGAFHPGVPPGLPAYFRNNGQAHESSDAHSGHWQPAAAQQHLHGGSNREAGDITSATAFSKPIEGMSMPRPKSLRRSANHVYIAHMIVEWQRQLTRFKQHKPFQPPASSVPANSNPDPNPSSNSNPNPMPYTASAFAAESTQQPSIPNPTAPSQPARSSPDPPVKQEQPQPPPQQAPLPQHSTHITHIPHSMQSMQQPAPMPAASSSAFQYGPSPFNLGMLRPPPQPQAIGPRDASGNVIPPMQYYKNMLGPQKFEALQPRLPLLQPGATWPLGPPPGPSPFASAPPMLSPQQAAAFAAQMSMFAAAPHSLGSLPGFPPPNPLQAQLGNSQAMQASLLRGMRWPENKEQVTIQELPASSSSSPAAPHNQHSNGVPIKHEETKPEVAPPAQPPAPAPGISADALNRLIAMGGPAGFLDSHNLAQFGVPEHVLQAIKPQGQQNQDGRSTH